MILYKYVSPESAIKILRTNKIGFSQPACFNDPFDIPIYPENIEREEGSLGQKLASFFSTFKSDILAQRTGILSLTRQPDNPLMWAHYAKDHTGIVIGIDTVKAGFCNETTNMIPAQFGSVIYVNKRSANAIVSKPKSGMKVGGTYNFKSDHFEKLQRLFLHKPLQWAYEEEVRVIKCLPEKGSTDAPYELEEIDIGDRKLFVWDLPKKAIAELYFGVRISNTHRKALTSIVETHHPDLTAYDCFLDHENLSIRSQKSHSF